MYAKNKYPVRPWREIFLGREVEEMVKRGDARRTGGYPLHGEKRRGRRELASAKMIYGAGYAKGLRDGWWRGAIVGGVAMGIQTGVLLWVLL